MLLANEGKTLRVYGSGFWIIRIRVFTEKEREKRDVGLSSVSVLKVFSG